MRIFAKVLTRATVAGLLLTELSPTTATESPDPLSSPENDGTAIANPSSNQRLFIADAAIFKDAAFIAQPERFNEIEAPLEPRAVTISTEKTQPFNNRLADTSTQKSQPAKSTTISTQAKDLLEPEPKKSLNPDLSRPSSLPSRPLSPASVTSAPAPLPPAPLPPIPPQLSVDFTSGNGIGYSSSFTALRGFVPLAQKPGHNITFLEGQLLLPTESEAPSANVVIGHRFYDSRSDRIYGGYLAYDHRNTGHNGFYQLGLGLETLGKTWDVRANGYFPLGNTRQLASESISNSSTAFSSPFFQGNFLAVNRTIQQQIERRFEAAATGMDIEAGGKIANLGRSGDLRGYGGLYYFKAPGSDSILGWRARLEARPTESLRLGLALSRDETFGTNLVFSLGVTFPTRATSQNASQPTLLARLGEPVNRNANIVIDRQVEKSAATIQDTRLVTNPTTGQPWRFRHAIPGIGTGNGTFENPTGTVANALAVAQPDDIYFLC